MVQAAFVTPRPSVWSTAATTPLGWMTTVTTTTTTTTHGTGMILPTMTPRRRRTHWSHSYMTSSADHEEQQGTELWRMGRLSKTVATPSQVESLVVYLQTVFGSSDTDTRMKLTTPVKVQTTPQGLRLLFHPNEPSYRDTNKKDNKDDDWGGGANNDDTPKETKAKKQKKQGGVEFIVEASPQLTVMVRRCNMDDDTMIREMSEETILSQLQNSIQVWKKEQNSR
jgi:hypothetical protein